MGTDNSLIRFPLSQVAAGFIAIALLASSMFTWDNFSAPSMLKLKKISIIQYKTLRIFQKVKKIPTTLVGKQTKEYFHYLWVNAENKQENVPN